MAKEFSYQSIADTPGIKSTTSVRNYIEYLQRAYLMFELYKYDYSQKKQFVSNKKMYSVDTGLRNAVGFRYSTDTGRLLENVVFVELKRRQHKFFFYRGKNECDFVIEEEGRIRHLIQVCYSLDMGNEGREIKGLMEAAGLFRLRSGIIITNSQDKIRKTNGITVRIIPARKWLLNVDQE
jgi:predicted AAA+ superfamily ATPase